MADANRKIQEARGPAMVGQTPNPTETTTRGSSSQQGRETTTRGSSELQEGTGSPSLHTGRGSSEYAKSLCEREHAMGERELGMSDRERGMGDRERAMYDRECAMSDRERSSAWGGEESGGMQTGRGTQAPQSGSDR